MAKYSDNAEQGYMGDWKRGAPIGRGSKLPADPTTDPIEVTLNRVRLDSEGYDPEGTYFGIGEPLYWAATDDGELDMTFRAADREAAETAVRLFYPSATFVHGEEGTPEESELLWWYSECGRLALSMTREQAEGAHHQGQCDEDVASLADEPNIASQLAKFDPAVLRSELRGCGGWNAEELADHEQNLQRVLWLAAGSICDEADSEDTN
jgi:hypothetical protein